VLVDLTLLVSMGEGPAHSAGDVGGEAVLDVGELLCRH
jgi:hypothetical protein